MRIGSTRASPVAGQGRDGPELAVACVEVLSWLGSLPFAPTSDPPHPDVATMSAPTTSRLLCPRNVTRGAYGPLTCNGSSHTAKERSRLGALGGVGS